MMRMTKLLLTSQRFARGGWVLSTVLSLLVPFSVEAAPSCAQVLKVLGSRLADATCLRAPISPPTTR